MRYFILPITVTIVGILTSFLWGGWEALFLTLMLSLLEISLSLDNAIVNATVLQKLNANWQRRFITWGNFISIFVVRFLIPLCLVAVTAHLNILEVVDIALNKPAEYALHVQNAHPSLSAFGGMFLFLVFLSFIFNKKNNRWLNIFVRDVNRVGKLTPIKLLITFAVLLFTYQVLADSNKTQVLYAGIMGIVFFTFLNSLIEYLNSSVSIMSLKSFNLVGFIYLEILDASFSFDGVVTAFAITKDLVIIFIGLGIGAIFMRSFTLYLTHHKTLQKFRYLEHGAHYAVGALSILMLLSLKFQIPELAIGLVGGSFILLAFLYSLWHK